MAINNFGQGPYVGPVQTQGISQNQSVFGNRMNGTPQTQPVIQPSNILVIPASSDEVANDYPLAAGTTAMLMNYPGRRFWLKTQHANGLSYDMERCYFFTEAEFKQLQEQLQKLNPPVEQTQTTSDFVSRSEFLELKKANDELKKLVEEFIK